jgi:membrane-associated protein
VRGVFTLDGLADLAALAYFLVFGLAALDVVLPVLPSESVVILGGVLSWQGRLHPVPLVAAAAVGALMGDHLSYGIGRWTQRGKPDPRGGDRRKSKVARLQAWAGDQLERRGPEVLIIARFVPGGRTAATFMAGRTAYPLRRFTPAALLAALLWAGFAVTLGYVGGTTFHDQTFLATGLGILLAVSAAGVVELITSRLRRRIPAGLELATADAEGDDGDDDLAA